LKVASQAYPNPANGHFCDSIGEEQHVPNAVPQIGRQVPLWQAMLSPHALPVGQQACPLPPHTLHVPPMHCVPPCVQLLPGQHT
jgi:hypothetical protein